MTKQKEARIRRMEERMHARAKRAVQEKLDALDARPGFAKRERKRLAS